MQILLILLALTLSQPASASSLAVYNISQERWIHSENLNQTRPIASLTKLMTVMVSLDSDRDLDRAIKLTQASPRRV